MTLTLGLPRMHKEKGERRDFLPALAEVALAHGAHVLIEDGLGSGLGLLNRDYTELSRDVRVVGHAEAWHADLVLVLRSPEVEDYERLLRPRTTLMAVLHFPTRPRRIAKLRALDVEAISLDSIADDSGARRVENTRAVGWNGVDAAFTALERFAPTRLAPGAPLLRVTVLGSGQVGRHAIDAATKHGQRERTLAWATEGRPAVEVTVVGRGLMQQPDRVRQLLRDTDVLVDASQRADCSTPLIPNAWVGELPPHAVICDLVVDPYVLQGRPPTVRSIEGIPRGDLDRFIVGVDDPAWGKTVPASVPQRFRRPVVSCYSWPGVQPRACMEHYGAQLAPLLGTWLKRGGTEALRPDGDADERALCRASLRAQPGPVTPPPGPAFAQPRPA